jgi:spore maturation protein CgeB
MRIVMFYHSLISDWNHGNAHFLRGIASELLARGHDVAVYEPSDGWSLTNLLAEHGPAAVERFSLAYPTLKSVRYNPQRVNLQKALDSAQLVIVHEWNPPALVKRIGERRKAGGFRLLFHDTHHRMVSDPRSILSMDLSEYDGVLAFGSVLRDMYAANGWDKRAWTWHEAADTRVFRPLTRKTREGDVVWVGNWGDDERAAELREFLIEPVKDLKLAAAVYGVRYPRNARTCLRNAGIEYRGWLANFDVPGVFSRYAFTVHVPRRAYATQLPGIPTIRPFEAMSCGIPLICSPWNDSEGLFKAGHDYLLAHTGAEMRHCMRMLLEDSGLRQSLARNARRTILARHTCAHRVDELLEIYARLTRPIRSRAPSRCAAARKRSAS